MESRRREATARSTARRTERDGRVSLADWLDRDGDELVAEFDRLYVPRNDPRWLRRNALIAAGQRRERDARAERRARTRTTRDPILSDAARWAPARIAERGG